MEITIKVDEQAAVVAPGAASAQTATGPSGAPLEVDKSGAIDAGPAPGGPTSGPSGVGGLSAVAPGAASGTASGGHDAGAAALSESGQPPAQIVSAMQSSGQGSHLESLSAGPAPAFGRQPSPVVVEAEE